MEIQLLTGYFRISSDPPQAERIAKVVSLHRFYSYNHNLKRQNSFIIHSSFVNLHSKSPVGQKPVFSLQFQMGHLVEPG
jgi:hypothetical protein